MESDLSTSSLSSSSPTMTTNNKDANLISLNHAVAVSNSAGGFILGKVTEQRNDSFILNIYQYKLDTRTQLSNNSELIMGFGDIEARTIFEMSSDQQRILFDRVSNPDQYPSSLLSLMVEIKKRKK
ncbi:unnamed protein product [Rotaria magnacalcarata]|uniref:Uncharacterized protein n=1 Tax=Rotaria magnacalcarata TaxID=392030 RepID=A0A8S2IUB3_9BILA|nr:unnamed protein product [Rotaria magnacalcarata]CAF3825590.1 unnamed protein product [Rotaria magnacalcarata]